jgi:predicted metal-dependent enzyme (double-stranded beta helix superfamily)
VSFELVLDTPLVRGFLGEVERDLRVGGLAGGSLRGDPAAFRRAARRSRLAPGRVRRSRPESGMGGGIGQWLLARADDGSLSLFSLVVPPGSQTPVHDHLAWGLVGLYRGTQDEEIYAPRTARSSWSSSARSCPGDFYALIPPRDDIHRVRTTSAETSVSIHLLTNDTAGVAARVRARVGRGKRFRSGYVNVACDD